MLWPDQLGLIGRPHCPHLSNSANSQGSLGFRRMHDMAGEAVKAVYHHAIDGSGPSVRQESL